MKLTFENEPIFKGLIMIKVWYLTESFTNKNYKDINNQFFYA